MNRTLPIDFVWGAASSAYQIEGAWATDGRGPSVWDSFCHQPKHVDQGHTGDVACDHYHRYAEDVSLMGEIGLQAYRFSVSWSRVIPDGDGATNEAGLDFYDRLVDRLLEHDIEPWVTLFHWDYPRALYLKGGWLNPDSPRWFADYTAVMVDRLSDRVSKWMTINEPQCFVVLGHHAGYHAPGLKLDLPDVLLAGHHSLLAHGLSVQTIRARAQKTPSVGWAPCGIGAYPVTESEEDIAAARHRTFDVPDGKFWNSSWWSDPVYLGRYPESGLRAYGKNAPRPGPNDMETICQPLDFCGVNIYSTQPVKSGPEGEVIAVDSGTGARDVLFPEKMAPESLYWLPKFLHERYKLPVVIAENGMACMEWPSIEGRIQDSYRIDFARRYLRELRRAVHDGVDIAGYFHWSIMDNFEWAKGYNHRFGLIHVDYQTGQRTPKASADWYRQVIATNGAWLDADPAAPEAMLNGTGQAIHAAMEIE